MSTQTFAERCAISEQCLPDAPYRAMLTKLHREMLAEIERLEAIQPTPPAAPVQEPVAWAVKTSGGKKWHSIHASKGASDKWLEYRVKKQAKGEQYEQHALCTAPLAQPALPIAEVASGGTEYRTSKGGLYCFSGFDTPLEVLFTEKRYLECAHAVCIAVALIKDKDLTQLVVEDDGLLHELIHLASGIEVGLGNSDKQMLHEIAQITQRLSAATSHMADRKGGKA
jgi:hypothetical protein